ncbi:MAG: hypothetical protein ACHQ1D_01570 [Nitrososphaerales archaeon]
MDAFKEFEKYKQDVTIGGSNWSYYDLAKRIVICDMEDGYYRIYELKTNNNWSAWAEDRVGELNLRDTLNHLRELVGPRKFKRFL